MPLPRIPPTWLMLAFAGLVGLVWLAGDAHLRAVASSFGLVAFTVLGSVECWRRRKDGERRSRAGWALLGLFLGVVSLILCGQTYEILARGAMGHTHLKPALLIQFTASFVLLIPASLSFARRLRWTWFEALDGAIFALAFYLCLWIWVLRGVLATGPVDALQSGLLQLTFVVISISAGVAMNGWAGFGFKLRHPQSMVAMGLLVFIANAVWRVQVDLGGGFTYAHPVRLAFLPAMLLLWLACRQPLEVPPLGRIRKAILLALPYLPALLAFPAALIAYLPSGATRDATGFFLMGSLALLLLARQALVLRQIEHLNHTLEGKVLQRTAALAQSQAMILRTQRMNLVATLGAGVAHDLSNLLTSAIGYLDIAREDLRDGGGEADGCLERAQKSLGMASDLSRRIMAVGRGAADSAEVLDLGQHLRNLTPVLRATLPRTLDLQVLVSGKDPIPLLASGPELDQILVNLVMNARDATPAGGRIWVRARLDEAGGPTLEVEDTGSGIPEAVLSRIFEPFFTTKPAGQGTGLGLASIQAVAAGMHGELSVHSEEGRGARFTLRFPPIVN